MRGIVYLGVQVRVGLHALGALELSARGEGLVLNFDLLADLVQLVLDYVDEHLVVDEEVGVLRLFAAVVARLHEGLLVYELFLLEVLQVLLHSLQVQAQQFSQIVLLDTRIEHEHLHAEIELEAVECAHDGAYEETKVARYLLSHVLLVVRR